jgi:hypothetical protein
MNIKKLRWLLAIPLILIMLTACSVFQPYKSAPINEDEARSELIRRLTKWDTCTARGIVAVYDKNYEFKSDFLLQKKKEWFRLDAFSTGLLGISPSIKLQVLYVDSLQVFVPERKTLYTLSSNELVNLSPSYIATAPLQYDPQNKKFILFYENIKMNFDESLDLEAISYNDTKILFTQYKMGLSYQIDIWRSKDLIASFTIDKWEFGDLKDELFHLSIPSTTEIVPISKLEDIKLNI